MGSVEDTSFPSGRAPRVYLGAIFPADTTTGPTAKVLFTMPANSIVVGASVIGNAATSNAGTAVLNIGVGGLAGNEYLKDFNVKDATLGQGFSEPSNWTNLGSQNSNYSGTPNAPYTVGSNDIPVTGSYTRVGGTASGGPWTVVFWVVP